MTMTSRTSVNFLLPFCATRSGVNRSEGPEIPVVTAQLGGGRRRMLQHVTA
jgi:hypothetical protein